MTAKESLLPERVVYIPEILLPQTDDMYAWAVNACDQFTSDASYWRQVEEIARGKLSAYHLILPEIYLKDDLPHRIGRINANMREYLSRGVFRQLPPGFILVERTLPYGVRSGIVLGVDLECYSFDGTGDALIRSTEATVMDRLPPRVSVREDAPLELPHVMVLYDDPENCVLSSVRRGNVLYDFDLNMGGGHVKGTFVENSEQVKDAFNKLCPRGGMLFAAGDGNHSLAAAKLCWERIKPGLDAAQRKTHPARYALCEAVNIYDPALTFHPIHRLVKTGNPEDFVRGWDMKGDGMAVAVCGGKRAEVPFPRDVPSGIRMLDDYIEKFVSAFGGEADYIHGDGELVALSRCGVGVLVPRIEKEDLFPLIERGGNLPKKTFSLGEGREKRYYIEAKRIK